VAGELTREQLLWAVRGSGLGVWKWEIATDEITWSLGMGDLFELPEASFPRNLSEYEVLLHPDDRERVQRALSLAIASRLPVFEVEHRIAKASGGIRWIGGKARLETDEAGNPIRLAGTAVDITDQKAIEQQAAQLRIYSELASDYVYVVEVREGQPLAPSIVAGSFERATGYTTEQVAEQGGWLNIIHPEDLPGLEPVFAGVAQGKPMVAEYRIIGADGESRWLRDHIRPELKDGALVRMVGGVQDLTQQKALEARLSHAQRMEALARISGSVAHDFNNLLLVISASVDLMEPALAGSADARGLADDIRTACERATDLTRTLLTFGRKLPTNVQVVLLSDVVRQWRTVLARAAGERVTLSLEISETTAMVELDTAQLQLALLNLTLNAKAAMPAGGKLVIRVRPGDATDGRVGEIEGKPFVALEVSDTGGGIAPDVLPRIFEPFFTTKGPVEGTGLGLATCHEIVTQARGAIRVKSKLGAGTTFSIYLPATTRAPASRAAAQFRGAVGGTERILLLEDEPAVRRLAKRILDDHGYSVTSVSTIREARTLFLNEQFALFLSDIRLPDGSGASLAQELRSAHAGLGVVLISGFVPSDALDIIERNAFPLLHKPFGSEALARLVRETLDKFTGARS